MKILVTGSTGMVGQNFKLDPRGQAYHLLTPRRSELDLTQFGHVLDYFKNNQPDLVVHCASRVGGIAANIKSPVEFLSENIDISKNVIMAAHQSGVKKFINLSSSCVYPRYAANPLKEELILTGELEPTNEAYAIAKISALKLCSYISKQSPEKKYVTLIPCNLYGNYDRFDPLQSHMIPAVILKMQKAIEANSAIIDIWGDGQARREFMIASDLVDCIYRCIENFDTVPELMNVGLGRDYSIAEYYQIIAKVLGYKGEFAYDLTKPVGMKQKLVDVSRVQKWGWTAKTNLQDGIKQAYEYFLTSRTV